MPNSVERLSASEARQTLSLRDLDWMSLRGPLRFDVPSPLASILGKARHALAGVAPCDETISMAKGTMGVGREILQMNWTNMAKSLDIDRRKLPEKAVVLASVLVH